MIRRCEERAILAGGLNMLPLSRRGRNMGLPRDREFRWRRLRDNSTRTAVVADIVGCLIDDNIPNVNIGDVHVRYVVNGGIIEKIPIIPISAHIASAGIAKSIVDATIEPNLRSPIPFLEHISAIDPAPVSWRPKQARLRREDPSARHPIKIIAIRCPIPRRPYVTRLGNWRLFINRQWRRRDIDSDIDDHLCMGRK
jgi:hypothetical protein